MEGLMDKLYVKLEKIEKSEDKSGGVIKWLEQITAKESGLVESLLTNFIDKMADETIAKKILLILK
jgi:hypothetical protein